MFVFKAFVIFFLFPWMTFLQASDEKTVTFEGVVEGQDVSPLIFRKAPAASPLRSPFSRSADLLSPRGFDDVGSARGALYPSPLRPCSPNPLLEEYGQICHIVRPGAGVELSEKDHDIIEAAVVKAAHYAPDLEEHNMERVREFCEKHAPFQGIEERHTGDWHTLVSTLQKQGKTSLSLIAYGSLMDDMSSQEFSTRGDTVWAFGAKRSFDFMPPSPERSAYGIPHREREGEMLRLCVTYTGAYDDSFNGRLMQINLGDELTALRMREKGYDLVRLPAVRLSGAERPTMHLEYAYVLTRPLGSLEEHPSKRYAVSKDPIPLSPHIGYLYACMNGATALRNPRMAHGLTHFLHTTHVRDMRLCEWVKQRTPKVVVEGLISPRSYCRAMIASNMHLS